MDKKSGNRPKNSANSHSSTLAGCSVMVVLILLGGMERAYPDDTGKETNAVRGELHTWQDGEITRKVWFQTDLVARIVDPDVEKERQTSDVGKEEMVLQSGNMRIVKRAPQVARAAGDMPVFRGGNGRLMTLPGGAFLVLDSELTEEQTRRFFAEHEIRPDRVSKMEVFKNGFFIKTEAGWPSLDLANRLAGEDTVKISSPNWWRKLTLR